MLRCKKWMSWRRLCQAVLLACVWGLTWGLAPNAEAQGAEQEPMHTSRRQARATLARVEHWGCQYQKIEQRHIVDSPLDLIVIDPILDPAKGRMAEPAEIEAMQRKPDGGRRLVFAYLSIGEAEEYRPYWNQNWRANEPAWLGTPNPKWPRSHSVRYWDPNWQRIVGDTLRRIVAAGFDGVFLDRVDAYHEWRGTHERALDDMADFVLNLAQTARSDRPGFLLIGQNAENLLAQPRYSDAIDAVSKESLLTGLKGEGINNQPDEVAWSMNYLVPAQRSGLTILTIEYLDMPRTITAVQRRHRAMGFVPFIGNRLLDRLPSTQ
jgi:cysteinyl-tRNA synthetase, unknown class